MHRKSMVLALTLAIVLVTAAQAQQPAPTQSPAPSTQPAPATGPAVTPATPATPPAVQPGTPAAPPAAAPAKPATPMPPSFDPFAAPGQKLPMPQQQQTNPGYPGGYGDDDGYTPPPPPDPVPQNPVQQSYEDGKIVVVVGADRHFGYRIGDRVELSIIVVADEKVKVDFTAIAKGVYGLNGSDFETVSPPVTHVLGKKQGKIAYRIDLTLRSFVLKKGIVFNADFLYATDTAPDGKTPNWQRLTTPDFVVSTSNTADNGENLYEGDTEYKPFLVSWFTYPLLLLGLSLILLWPAAVVVRWLQRVRPRRKVPANELAWNTFDRVIKEGKEKGFTVRHYKQIASALRTYLGVESLTQSEVALKLKSHKDLDAIMSALDKFDSVLYDKGFLTDKELRQLVSELKSLVPRP